MGSKLVGDSHWFGSWFSQIGINSVGVSFGGEPLLEDVSLRLRAIQAIWRSHLLGQQPDLAATYMLPRDKFQGSSTELSA